MPRLGPDSSTRLNQYVQIARRDVDGDMRFSRNDGERLINKGTLGHRLADFFANIGRKLGLVRSDPTRAGRQENAIKDFTDTLTDKYGEHVARKVLKDSGLNAPGARLTGRIVLHVTEKAQSLGGEYNQTHKELCGRGEQFPLWHVLDDFGRNLYLRPESEDGEQRPVDSQEMSVHFARLMKDCDNELERLSHDSGVPTAELRKWCEEMLNDDEMGIPNAPGILEKLARRDHYDSAEVDYVARTKAYGQGGNFPLWNVVNDLMRHGVGAHNIDQALSEDIPIERIVNNIVPYANVREAIGKALAEGRSDRETIDKLLHDGMVDTINNALEELSRDTLVPKSRLLEWCEELTQDEGIQLDVGDRRYAQTILNALRAAALEDELKTSIRTGRN